MTKQKYGWFRQNPDARDWRYEDVAPAFKAQFIPSTVDLSDLILKVKDQGALGSCTSQGTTSAFEALQIKRNGRCTYGSRLFNYHWGRVLCKCYPGDNGADIRSAVKATGDKYYGLAPEVDMPYDITKFDAKIPPKATIDAKKFESTNYYLVDSMKSGLSTLANLKKALAVTGLPVVFGTPVYEQFESVGHTGIVHYPSMDEDPIGGHCMMAYGYMKNYVLVLNSWGENNGWGMPFGNGRFKGGACKIPNAYWTTKLAVDNWCIAGESAIKGKTTA